MAHLTADELAALMYAERLADCCDDDADGTADPLIVAAVIDAASSVGDGYAATAGLPVPLAGAYITAAVKHHSGFIAAHFAAQRRPEFREQSGFAPYRQEYLDAIAWWEKVAARKILLTGADTAAGSAAAVEGGGMVLHSYQRQRPARTGPRKMRGW